MSTVNSEFFKNFSIFKNLSSEELHDVAGILTKKIYQTGEIIIEQDELSSSAFIIESGGVKVYRLSVNGEQISLAILGPGEIVGELSLLDSEPRSAFVEAIQESVIFTLSRDSLLRILSSQPNTAINLLKTLAARLRQADERVEDILSRNLSERTWKMLLALVNYFPNKNIALSQEELAEIIGATRSRVTEVLNKLQAEGKITLSHRKIQLI